MVKKTITYTDFDGNKRTEDFYFNLTKAEAVELDASTPGGLSTLLSSIQKENDIFKGLQFMKDFILKAYGEKSSDGKKFMKSAEISAAFYPTEAYSELFWELCTNPDAMTQFINGVLPHDALATAMASNAS